MPPTIAVTSSLGSICHWWRAEAHSLTPGWLKWLLLPHARTVSLSLVTSERFDVYETPVSLFGRSGARTLIFSGGKNDAIERAAARRKRWGPLLRVELVVPLARCLMLEHRLPQSALARAASIVTLEMERTTPLRATEVFQDFFVSDRETRTNGTAVVQQVAIRKSAVEDLLTELRMRGVPAGCIAVTGSEDRRLPVDLLARSSDRRSTFSGRLNSALMAAALLGAALALINAFHGIWALETALGEQSRIESGLKQQVAGLRKQIATQNTLQNRAKNLRLRKIETLSTLQVWEEVTQRLPSSAWISELRLDDGMLFLDGFSRSASELIGIFARSPNFTKVEFVSPVTRDAQQDVERFQLRMKVEHRGAGVADHAANRAAAP
jgi:general secretion pathway protein L